MAKTLYDQLRTFRNLELAWRTIRDNGRRSACPETQGEVDKFGEHLFRNLRRIQSRLQKGRYEFERARGVPIARKDKKPRPLVLAPLADRIVQRSILQVLQAHQPVNELLTSPMSFGTSGEQSIAKAMAIIDDRVKAGAKFVIRSDIRDFFTRIPRAAILDHLSPVLNDAAFSKTLHDASTVELANRAELGEKVNYFPDDVIGVAQGSSLSPFLGNIFLREFDQLMNSFDVTCLRYVDDFLLLGRRERTTRKAFESALQWLENHRLQAHELGTEKCHFGSISDGFDFLGCTIHPGLVLPAKAARTGILGRVQEILDASITQLEKDVDAFQRKATVARALYDVGNVTYAWGSAYKFCNGLTEMRHLEAQVDDRVLKYMHRVSRLMAPQTPARRCRMLGVPSLAEVFSKSTNRHSTVSPRRSPS